MPDVIHYGVQGMRWGVRKDKPTPAKDLSTTELRARIDRMDLEKRYSKLLSESQERAIVEKGTSAVGGILANAAKTAVTAYAANQMGKALKLALGGL